MPCQSPMNARSKKPRISAALPRLGFDSLDPDPPRELRLDHRGGRAISCYGEPDSPVYLVLTPQGKWAVGYGIDLPRTVDEELAGLGYEPVSLPSFGKTMPEAVTELAVGRVAADGPFPGAQDISAEIGKLYEPLLPEEMARYAEAAQTRGRIISEIARWVQPGMTERQVMARSGSGPSRPATKRATCSWAATTASASIATPCSPTSPSSGACCWRPARRVGASTYRFRGWSISASHRPTSGTVTWPWRRCRPRCWQLCAPAFP